MKDHAGWAAGVKVCGGDFVSGVDVIPTQAATAFPGVARRDRAAVQVRRRLAAIAFLDVVAYSQAIGLDEEVTLREWSALQLGTIAPHTEQWHGRLVNRTGDGLFLEFRSAFDAFRWALDVQAAIIPSLTSLQLRVALHLGDVIDDQDGDVHGDGVNVAARLQAFAKPGGIIISEAIANEVAGKSTAVLSDLGRLSLRHISRPIHAFHLMPTPDRLIGAGNHPVVSPGWATLISLYLRPVMPWAIPILLLLLLGFGITAQHPDRFSARPVDPSPVEVAKHLLDQGRAVVCREHPCPQAWLTSRALYEQAMKADPGYGPPYAYDALTYTIFIANDLSLNEQEDLLTAERLATKAAALAPDDAAVYRAQGAVLALQPGRLQDALAAYTRSLYIDAAQPVVRGNIGWILILLGRPADAEFYLQAALEAAPANISAPAWLTYFGTAELFLSRPGHGIKQFQRAIALQSPRAASSDIGWQRSADLAAALALNGTLSAAREVSGRLRQQNPALSVEGIWNCDCSRAPGYVSGVALLKQGLQLAGVPDLP